MKEVEVPVDQDPLGPADEALTGAPLAAVPEPDPVAEPEPEDDSPGAYAIMESTDGASWRIIGRGDGAGAEDARRAYFDGEGKPPVDTGKQYVAVHRSSFKPARPKPRSSIAWSPVE